MTIAVILSAISAIIAMCFGIYAMSLRRQIFDICEQIKFIEKHDSNKKISTSVHNKAILTLADCMNEIIDQKRRIKIRAQNDERTFKDTISGISHDIRTPLTSLNGHFQLLKNSSDDKLNEKYINIIDGRINSLQDMIEQLFTFVKLENPSYTLECEQINLTQTVCDTLFSFYEELSKVEISPEVDLSDEIITVNANHAAVRRIIQNIIKNALTHGRSEINVRLGISGDFAEFTVSNPVAEDEEIDVDLVFERFYKADASRKKGSTGLGLFIAKQLAERMNGLICAKLDGGIFTVIFKLKRSAAQ